MKTNWGLIFLGICFVAGVAIMAHALNLASAVRTAGAGEHTATVTGYGVRNLKADNAHFSATVSVRAVTSEEGFASLPNQKQKVEQYLKEKGFAEFQWGELESSPITESNYSQDGNYMGERRIGTKVSQSISLNSGEVEKVRDLAIDITNLNAKGVEVSVNRPVYTLSDDLIEPLKLDLIDVATDNALVRASKLISGFSDGFRSIKRIDVGQFRITTASGDSYGEEYQIDKKVSVTVHAVYIIKE